MVLRYAYFVNRVNVCGYLVAFRYVCFISTLKLCVAFWYH